MLRKSIKNVSPPVKASLFFMIGSVLQQSINIITTPIFTRILSQSDYGITNVYQSWYGILSVIITLSLTAGVYNNAMLDFKDELNEFTSSMLILTTLSTSIYFIIYIIFNQQIANILNLPAILIYTMFLAILLNSAMGFWMAQQRFSYKYKLSVTISIFITLFGAIFSYLLVINMDGNKAVEKIIGGFIFTGVISLILYISIILKGKTGFNYRYWKYALGFNIPLIPHYLASIVLAQSDRIIISKMVGNAEAGLYGVAYSSASVISIVWTSINASWIPWTFKKMRDNQYGDIRKIANYIVILCQIACVIFISLAPEIIRILAAPSYYKAVWVVPPVVLGVYFTFLYTLFANIEFYYKKTKFIMVASIIGAIVNVVLNILLIPRFGYIAAAYTTLVAYMVFSFMHYFFMTRINDKRIYDIKFIFLSSFILILASFGIMCLYDYFIIRYMIIAIVLIIILKKRRDIMLIVKQIKK
ncbi:MAG: lipopolysaccharide biosynthesis protein [Clostridium sp.]|uniref:lipopolysaccharide biosynthesis protein n=1 Tax=Clostridium sp. TaxID=1506 RepID=UPI003D6D7812